MREAWGDDHIVVLGGYRFVSIYPRERAMDAWMKLDDCATIWDSELGFGMDLGPDIHTEAEGLVAALEAIQ